TLYYPKWIPGEHAPTGPVTDVAGLTITAGGAPITWQRDPENMYAIRCEAPSGATALEISFDYLSPPGHEGFSSAASASSRLAILSWNQIVLYPMGSSLDEARYAATVRMPQGWSYATSLSKSADSGSTVMFDPVSLSTLLDSPILTAQNMRTERLSASGEVGVFLHIAADPPADLDVAPETVGHYRRLAAETLAL